MELRRRGDVGREKITKIRHAADCRQQTDLGTVSLLIQSAFKGTLDLRSGNPGEWEGGLVSIHPVLADLG